MGGRGVFAWKMELAQAQLGLESEVKSRGQKKRVNTFQGRGLTVVLVMVLGRFMAP